MNDPAIDTIWVYLSASPLLGLTIILGQYTGYRFSELFRFRHMQRL